MLPMICPKNALIESEMEMLYTPNPSVRKNAKAASAVKRMMNRIFLLLASLYSDLKGRFPLFSKSPLAFCSGR